MQQAAPPGFESAQSVHGTAKEDRFTFASSGNGRATSHRKQGRHSRCACQVAHLPGDVHLTPDMCSMLLVGMPRSKRAWKLTRS